ncbi:M15 family metallopeptidase [Actinophytocola sp.]|uniref:M15 family metallopeptidase n=1 Tax=Actinophytocola sp. TaxID=1872138 RepID=UPI002D7F16A7|nr:M15 family metallopeptidase [Actinophytocola sp.]HET9140636.1 M15 family metallopeptidase [Actinophytocola sp.]
MSTPTPATTTANRSPEQAATSLFNDVRSTASAIDRGDWLSAGMGVTNVAMDIISLGGDPLGAISQAGFGWLISHIKFLREPFDKLLGDVNSITGSAQGWIRAGQQLVNSAGQYRTAATRETTCWTGAAGDAYRTTAETQSKNLETMSKVCQAVSGALSQAGKALAEVRKMVMDFINQACNRIIMIIIEALAAAWGSFGASIAKGIAQSVQTAVQTAQKCLTKIQKLVQTLQKIIQLVQKIMQLVNAVKQLMSTIGGVAGGQDRPGQTTAAGVNYGGNLSAGVAPPGSTTNLTFGQVDVAPVTPYTGPPGATQVAQARGGAPVASSQNGWPINPPLQTRTIPGTNVRVSVARGPAGDVLIHVLTRFHYGVEPLDAATTGGYNPRTIGSTNVWSNHASGTAVDANWGAHPQGSANTYTPAQVAEIRRILGDVQVVRWGGDFRHAAIDEMHFEIHGTQEEVQRAAERVRAIEMTP